MGNSRLFAEILPVSPCNSALRSDVRIALFVNPSWCLSFSTRLVQYGGTNESITTVPGNGGG